MRGAEHDKLWNQLEAEIHLHRHKTVIRACRGRANRKKKLLSPPGHVSITWCLFGFFFFLFVCFLLMTFPQHLICSDLPINTMLLSVHP